MKKTLVIASTLLATALVAGTVAVGSRGATAVNAEGASATTAAAIRMPNVGSFVKNADQTWTITPNASKPAETWTANHAWRSESLGIFQIGDTETGDATGINAATEGVWKKIYDASGWDAGRTHAIMMDYDVVFSDITVYWKAAEVGYLRFLYSLDSGDTWKVLYCDDGEQSASAAGSITGLNGEWDNHSVKVAGSNWHSSEIVGQSARIAITYTSFGGIAAHYLNMTGILLNQDEAIASYVARGVSNTEESALWNCTSKHTCADNYCNAFLSNTVALCDNGVTKPSAEKWALLKETFNGMSQGEKDYLTDWDANPEGNIYAKTIARYEAVLTRYGTAEFENFMDLEGTYPTFGTNSYVFATDNATALVAGVSLLALAGASCFAFYLRRKHN